MLLDKEITEAVIEGFISIVKNMLSIPIEHVKLWNMWRKLNANSKFYKFLVLMGLIRSPSFKYFHPILSIEKRKVNIVDYMEFMIKED